MGDNVRLTDHDKLIAADEINDIKHLKIKMTFGEDDSVTSVSPSNPLPVTLGSENITITGDVNVGTTVTVNSSEEDPVHVHVVEIPEVEIKNDVDNPIPISGSVTVAGLVEQIFSERNTDAFGKLRVSQPTTLGDYHHISGENPEMLLKTSGSGAGSADVPTSSYILSVGTGDGDYAIHQSKMYHHYLPGKSQLILESFCLGSARNNTLKRVGYFDDRNGIFLQQSGNGSLSFVLRSYITGGVGDTVIPQAQWNQNTCNTSITGTGILPNGENASNYGIAGTWNLDVTKTQLLMIDFQWLGVGRIRIGFVHDGNWIVAHEIYNSNYGTNVYWTQSSLPIRCEMRNNGVATGTATMKQICATVMSEGGYLETGLVNLRHSSLTGRTIQNGGDSMCVLAIRLKNSFNGDLVRGIVRALQASLIITNSPVFFELVRFNTHTSITGGSWFSHASDSIVEYNATATGYSNGVVVSGQFLEAAKSVNTTSAGAIVNPVTNKRGFITQNYDSSESEAYGIVVTALDSSNNINIKVYAALQWSETR